MDQRRHDRQRIRASIKYSWRSVQGRRLYGIGLTRDFSAGGLFVMTDVAPPLGAIIHCEIDFAVSIPTSKIWIRAKGNVSRVEQSSTAGQAGGFAMLTRRVEVKRKPSRF
jgi:hypothetical protein